MSKDSYRYGMRLVLIALYLFTTWAGAGAQSTSPVKGRPEGLRHFITRQGDKLMDGAKEFRFIGVNMPGQILPYDYSLNIDERMVLPDAWELEDSFKTLSLMNARCVRWVMLPARHPQARTRNQWEYVLGPGRFNEASFRTIDQALALANRYGIRVIFALTGAGGYPTSSVHAGVDVYAAWRGKPASAFYTDPQIREDFKATIRYVLNRTNSLTSVRYTDDKAILCWQLGNELHGAKSNQDILTWERDIAAYIKSLDPNHLVMDGVALSSLPNELDPNIDIYTQHYYSSPAGWAGRVRAEAARLKGKRPFVVGEFGPYINEPSQATSVMDGYRQFLDAMPSSGAAGALIWSMFFHHRDGGFWWHQIISYPTVWAYHWPGFASANAHREREVLQSLREKAFHIQGLTVPPMPVPDAPELLPIGDLPLLSWRGSAGAAGYDVERATNAAGPWTSVAENASDADTAYRPLLCDTSARTGVDYFYRVIARNESGKSASSKVVGPVRYRLRCLVDEFQNLNLVHQHAQELKLDNEFNGLYAEYLFRAKGDAGQWLLYHLPGAIRTVKIASWVSGKTADLDFAVSADGKAFEVLKPARRERAFGNPPLGPARNQRRTLVEYEAQVEGDNRYFKILWRGPAELDRVELDYQ